jgi:DNA polymerase III subunit delta'
MLFSEIIGQKDVKQRLVQSVKDNRISHALLFSGPEGSGNLLLALAYIQYINCENRSETDSCGQCPSCLKYQKIAHPDLHFVFPVNTNQEVKGSAVSDNFLPQWRQKITEQKYFSLFEWYETIQIENKQGIIGVKESDEVIKKLSLKAFEAEYKAMVIWQPEKMNTEASNKLLKILEEPPEKTLFMLVTEKAGALLPTIISRTQLVKVPVIREDDMTEGITSRHGLSADLARSIAKMAGGNFAAAQKMIAEGDEEDFYASTFISWMRMCFGAKVPDIIRWADSIAGTGRERQKIFLSYCLRIIRESILANYTAGKLNAVKESEKAFLSKFAPFVHHNNVIDITEEFNKASQHIERNANPKILFLDLSLKLTKLLRVKP